MQINQAIKQFMGSEETILNAETDLQKKHKDFDQFLSLYPDFIHAEVADPLYTFWEGIKKHEEKIEQAKKENDEAKSVIISYIRAFKNKPLVGSFINRRSEETKWRFSLDEKNDLKYEEYHDE